MKKILLIMLFALFPYTANSWDGYDWEKGSDIEIEKGNLVRTGEEIEIYDYGSGEYRSVDVEAINRYGNSVELEVYDQETGEYRAFDMED